MDGQEHLFDRKTSGPLRAKKTSPGLEESPRGQVLTAFFVDECRRINEADPPAKTTKRVAHEIGLLIGEGITTDALRGGLTLLVEMGSNPSLLPELVFQAQSPRFRDRTTPEERELLAPFLEEIGARYGLRWPTGSRWVHGLSAGTYVQDPLGVDRPDYQVPWSRPERQEVIAALRTRKEREVSVGKER